MYCLSEETVCKDSKICGLRNIPRNGYFEVRITPLFGIVRQSGVLYFCVAENHANDGTDGPADRNTDCLPPCGRCGLRAPCLEERAGAARGGRLHRGPRDRRPHGRGRLRCGAGRGRLAAVGDHRFRGSLQPGESGGDDGRSARLLPGLPLANPAGAPGRRTCYGRCGAPRVEPLDRRGGRHGAAAQRGVGLIVCHRPPHDRTCPDAQHQPHCHAAARRQDGRRPKPGLGQLAHRPACGQRQRTGQRLVRHGRRGGRHAACEQCDALRNQGRRPAQPRCLEHRVGRGGHRHPVGRVRRPVERGREDPHAQGQNPVHRRDDGRAEDQADRPEQGLRGRRGHPQPQCGAGPFDHRHRFALYGLRPQQSERYLLANPSRCAGPPPAADPLDGG